jgi:hypothetical protein
VRAVDVYAQQDVVDGKVFTADGTELSADVIVG